MDLQQFELELHERGDTADVWLVYVEDPAESLIRSAPALKLQRGFWTRGEAYACAYSAHEQRQWQHHHVFRTTSDVQWLYATETRAAEFEMTFGRSRELPEVVVTATEVAASMEAAR